MKMRFSSACLLAPLLALGVLVGCQKENGAALDFRHNPEGKGTPLAKFNGDSVTAEQLEQRALELSPFQRTRLQTQEGKKEMVEGFVRFELVVKEALERGLHKDPAVVMEAKRLMVERLLQQELQEKGGAPISEEEITARYEQHKSDFVKPEMVRMVHLFLAAPKGDAAKVAEAKKKIEALAAQAKGLAPMDFKAFGELARAHSEEKRTQPLDGDMRYLSTEELTEQFGAEVAAAAKTLANVGDLSEVVQTDQGFHVLKLQGRQAALNLTREMVKPQLVQGIASDRRGQMYAKLIERLQAKAGYSLDEAALAKVKIDMSKPAVRTDAPTAGFLPPANRGASLMNDMPVPPQPAAGNVPRPAIAPNIVPKLAPSAKETR